MEERGRKKPIVDPHSGELHKPKQHPEYPVENPEFSWKEGIALVFATFRALLPSILMFLLPLVLLMILLFWLFPDPAL